MFKILIPKAKTWIINDVNIIYIELNFHDKFEYIKRANQKP